MNTFCPNCFTQGFTGRCAACGYLGLSSAGSHLMLTPGTLLAGRYTLGRVLGAGGFGVTYLALDGQSGQKVAVKEYLPVAFAVRSADGCSVSPSSRENQETFEHGLGVFRREAETLSHFAGNQNVVQVYGCFAQNNTAYFAMEFLDGVNLAGLTRAAGGRLPQEQAAEIVNAVARTLDAVHRKGMLHRDISPENIFVTRQGEIKLIDFGATRFFVGERSRSLSVVLKPGFAPPEQYSSKGNQGPWTDLYALCATFYTIVGGQRPPDAPDRLAGAPLAGLNQMGIPPRMARMVEAGLQLDYRHRPQNMAAFLAGLQEGVNAVQPTPVPAVPASAPPPPQPGAGMAGAKGIPYVQSLRKGAAGDRWVLPKNLPISIGRSAERCNVVLDEPNVSRVHCEIRYDEKTGLFYLTDLSTNGTLVDAGRLEHGRPYALPPGGKFYILTLEGVMEVGLC